MQFTTPNSAGLPELDEANAESSNGWLTRQMPRPGKKRKLREFNRCHSPNTGRFCSDKLSKLIQRRRGMHRRADAVMTRLDQQMRNVGGSVKRALSIRKRMDVAGPLARARYKDSLTYTSTR